MGLNGNCLKGNSIVVQPLSRGLKPDRLLTKTITLKIQKVPQNVSMAKLDDFFGQYGSLKSITVEKNETAFVIYFEGYNAQTAFHELNGCFFQGINLNIEIVP